jgi:hypothetical protein
VTAASEHAAPDRERAETYLRLLAEAELRRALAMPVYKPPGERMPARMAGLLVQSSTMRHRRAMMAKLVRQQARGTVASSQNGDAIRSRAVRSIAALPVIRRSAQALDRARTIAAPPTATLLKAGSKAGNRLGAASRQVGWQLWRPFRRFRRHGGYQPPPAEACLTRLETVAGVFATVGAVTAETEEDVAGGLRAALAARSRIEQDDLLSYHHRFRGHPMRRRASGTAVPSGPARAIPVGASATGEIEGVAVRFYLGVLLFDQGNVTLTIRVRFPEELLDDDDRGMDPVYEALSEISAVDERGGSYGAHFSGGGGAGEWDGRLHLSPAPPPGVRWLDMTLPGAPVVRLRLDALPRDLQTITEPATTHAADRFVDAQTMQLLSREPTDLDWPSDDGHPLPLIRIACHLLAAGVLGAGSPSLRRLAAAAPRLGTQLPAPLAAIEPADLPADWLSLLSRAGCTDGPTGAIPIAVVLPDIDGVQCVIVELVSDSESATMQIHARGWPEPREPFGARNEHICWSARDDIGGRYVVNEGGSSYHNGEADLDLEISPPINPRARVLDIILTGTTTQVTVSVPLDWQEGL